MDAGYAGVDLEYVDDYPEGAEYEQPASRPKTAAGQIEEFKTRAGVSLRFPRFEPGNPTRNIVLVFDIFRAETFFQPGLFGENEIGRVNKQY